MPLCHMGTAKVQMSVIFMQSDLDVLCSSAYITVYLNSVSGQQRPGSACANAQADQCLCCRQIS